MKRIVTFLAVLGLASVAFGAAEVGKPAPGFTGTDIHGKTVNLSDYQGKVVVLESYNSDCPFCHNHYKTGAMQELQQKYTAKGVVWLLINSVNKNNPSYRTPEQAQKEWTEEKIAATDWIDDNSGKIGHEYGMKTTPQMFVINKDGILVYDGAIDDRPSPFGDPRTAHNYVEAALNKLLDGEKVTVTETKPYGCGVKYSG
ncbi:MAG TPA: redoxin domain-containing protein [Verrucomicrobiae bacterium]|nr:redoxin domain-containing protein [Verrucomicrobiae bacterium]